MTESVKSAAAAGFELLTAGLQWLALKRLSVTVAPGKRACACHE